MSRCARSQSPVVPNGMKVMAVKLFRVLIVVPLLSASATASADGDLCRFEYVRSPTISSFEHGIYVGSVRMVVDASAMKRGSFDMLEEIAPCDAGDGVCADLGDAPLYVPPGWKPHPMVWSHDIYEYEQAEATDDPRANGLVIYPITVFFLDSTGRKTPMAVYFLDAGQNLIGFVPKLGQGNALSSRTTNWQTSPYLLMGDRAPIACFKSSANPSSSVRP